MKFVLRIEGNRVGNLTKEARDWSKDLDLTITARNLAPKFNPGTQSIMKPATLLSFKEKNLADGIYVLQDLKKRVSILYSHTPLTFYATVDGKEIELNGH